MSTFKDQAAQDISTFMNTDEFADLLLVDDKQIRTVIAEATDNAHPLDYMEGVSLVRKVAHFDAAEFDILFGQMPREGVWMVVDGVRYKVVKSSNDYGIYVVTLEANVD